MRVQLFENLESNRAQRAWRRANWTRDRLAAELSEIALEFGDGDPATEIYFCILVMQIEAGLRGFGDARAV